MTEGIGFIGVGIMGRTMVKNLVKAGYPVTIFDVVRAAVEALENEGVPAAASSKEVAESSDTVITMLPEDPHVEAAIVVEDGVFAGARLGLLVIDMSTISPVVSRRIAEEGKKPQLRVLDAPVSGGDAGAIAETLSIMVGGYTADFEAAEAIFEAMGKTITHWMLLGIFLGQYCVNVLTWFFLAWFPIYLVKARGMTILTVGFVATLPALCGCVGSVLGGLISDALLRRGWSLSAARKTLIVAGMFVATRIVPCNVVSTQWAVIFFMSLAYFGKDVGVLGWALVSDVAPKTATGLAGGVFNTFGNLAGVVIPIVIG
jgi:hypothetical protein